MKKYILSSLTITFLLLSITACSQGKQISGSSNYITKNIKVGSFDQIKSMSSSDIVYTQKQGAPTVQIYGPDNIVELMETSVSGRTLTIKFKKNTFPFMVLLLRLQRNFMNFTAGTEIK